jgi:hypothetical protein
VSSVAGPGVAKRKQLCFFSACVIGLASAEPSLSNLRFS